MATQSPKPTVDTVVDSLTQARILDLFRLFGCEVRDRAGSKDARGRRLWDHAVQTSFFVIIPQVERGAGNSDGHLAAHLGGFMITNWPFGSPLPRLYYDRRALVAREYRG